VIPEEGLEPTERDLLQFWVEDYKAPRLMTVRVDRIMSINTPA